MKRATAYSSSCSQVILVDLYPFCCSLPSASENRQKIIKTSCFGVQGHSRSSMLTFLRSSSPVLVMISSMSVLICNRFHSRRVNSGKMTSFKGGGTSLLRPSSRETPSLRGRKFLSQKTRVFGAAYSKDFVVLAYTVLIRRQCVTDRSTDRQTPRPWLRCAN